jgi:6-phosphofructokinase 2
MTPRPARGASAGQRVRHFRALVVDTSGPALRRSVEAGAYLLNPNLGEFQALAGEELAGEAELIRAGRRLIDDGRCRVLVVSLGRGGALLVTAQGSRHIRAPSVPIRSKVGAGDSMVAGVVLGWRGKWRWRTPCGSA